MPRSYRRTSRIALAGGHALACSVVLLLVATGCAPVVPVVPGPALALEDPAFAATLDGVTRAPIVGGNRVEVLRNGDEIFPAQLAAIAAARTTISYAQYFFEEGEIGARILDAMAERCRAGVEVHLLFDAFGAAGMPSRYAATLRDAGCQFALFPTSLLRVNHRQHRRVLVVDGRIGFTGGSGLADKWLGNGRQAGHWRDTDVRLEGPIVAQLQAAFVEVWHEATGVVLTGPRYFPVLTPQGPARARIVTSAPSKHEFGIYTTLLLAMRAARQEILVTNPYFLPDAAMEAALLDAIHRGVRVSVLVPGPLDWTLVRAASRAGFGPLLEAGIAIWEYRPAMLHAKTMVIDGTLTMVGSANLDPRSYAIDAELDVFVLDPTLAHRMEAVFADDLTRARRVRYARWYARPFWRRLLEWLAIPLRSQL